jgi:ribonuclease BN (tRNA processing enzyme)
MKFGKVKLVFVPSLSPDHFAGFPGFFLSAREASYTDANMQSMMRMVLIGPKNS